MRRIEKPKSKVSKTVEKGDDDEVEEKEKEKKPKKFADVVKNDEEKLRSK